MVKCPGGCVQSPAESTSTPRTCVAEHRITHGRVLRSRVCISEARRETVPSAVTLFQRVSGLVWHGLAWSGQAWSGLAWPGRASSGMAWQKPFACGQKAFYAYGVKIRRQNPAAKSAARPVSGGFLAFFARRPLPLLHSPLFIKKIICRFACRIHNWHAQCIVRGKPKAHSASSQTSLSWGGKNEQSTGLRNQ